MEAPVCELAVSANSSDNWKPAQTWLSSLQKMFPHSWWSQRTRAKLQVLQGSPGFSGLDLPFVSPQLGRENKGRRDKGVFHIMQMICKLHRGCCLPSPFSLAEPGAASVLSARMEQQGLDLTSCLKQTKKVRQNVYEQAVFKSLDIRQWKTVILEIGSKSCEPCIALDHCFERIPRLRVRKCWEFRWVLAHSLNWKAGADSLGRPRHLELAGQCAREERATKGMNSRCLQRVCLQDPTEPWSVNVCEAGERNSGRD